MRRAFGPLLAVTAVLLVPHAVHAAWTEPTAAPPYGNVAAPLNVSSIDQTKVGSLTVQGSLQATAGLGKNYAVQGTSPVSDTAGRITSGIFGVGAEANISGVVQSYSAGVYGVSFNNASGNGVGVEVGLLGVADYNSSNYIGVYGWDNNNPNAYAGYFAGRLGVRGELCFDNGTGLDCATSWNGIGTGSQSPFKYDEPTDTIYPGSPASVNSNVAIGGTSSSDAAFFFTVSPDVARGTFFAEGAVIVGAPQGVVTGDGYCSAAEDCTSPDCAGQRANCPEGTVCDVIGGGQCVDTQAPAAPTGFAVSGTTGTNGVQLKWNSNAESDLNGYRVYQCTFSNCSSAILSADVSKDVTTTAITGLNNNTTYTFYMTAYDTGGNESARSSTIAATTNGTDVTAPTTPSDLRVNGSPGSELISLAWTASSDGLGSGVAGYFVYRCTGSGCTPTVQVGTAGAMPAFNDGGLTSSTTYAYEIAAFDKAGNISSHSNRVEASTAKDPNAPSVPDGLTLSGSMTPVSIPLGWNASTDTGGAGMNGYKVYRCTGASCDPTALVGTTTDPAITTFVDAGLSPDTTYTYAVAAYDRDGNESAKSATVSFTTLPPSADAVRPTDPSGLTAGTVTSTSIGLSWNGSTDDGGSGLAGYHVYRCTGSGCTPSDIFTNTTDTAVTLPASPSTTYNVEVSAYDNAGNESLGRSNRLAVRSADDTQAPNPPTNLVTTDPITSDTIPLTWSIGTDLGGSSIAGFKLYRCTGSGCKPTFLADLGDSRDPNDTSRGYYIDGGLHPNTSYLYEVTEYDSTAQHWESAHSNTAIGTTAGKGDGGPNPEGSVGASGSPIQSIARVSAPPVAATKPLAHLLSVPVAQAAPDVNGRVLAGATDPETRVFINNTDGSTIQLGGTQSGRPGSYVIANGDLIIRPSSVSQENGARFSNDEGVRIDAHKYCFDNTTTCLDATGVGGSAPAGAQYLTLANDSTLTAERKFSVGSPLSFLDSGANGTYTIGLGTVGVDKGGTGQTSLPANSLLIGNGISPIATVSGGAGTLLAGVTGGAPTFSSTPTLSGSLTVPIVYGSDQADQHVTLDSTSNAAKGNIYLNPSGGNVGIGTNTRLSKLTAVGAPAFTATGTASAAAGTNDVTGTGTSFTTQIVPGDRITLGSETKTVTSVSDAEHLKVDSNYAAIEGGAMTVLPSIFQTRDVGGNVGFVVSDRAYPCISGSCITSWSDLIRNTPTFTSQGSANFNIDGSGRIGTSLQVDKSIVIGDSINLNETNSFLKIKSSSANDSGLIFANLTSGSPSTGSASTVLSVDANGKVVLVDDAAGISGTIAAGQVAYGTGSNTIGIGGEDAFSWDATNNKLGIGTSPGVTLDVLGADGNGTIAKFARGGNEKPLYISSVWNTDSYLSSEGNLRLRTNVPADNPLGAGAVEAVMIDTSGNIGIGTTSPDGTLTVESDSGTDHTFFQNSTANDLYSGGTMVTIRNSGTATNNDYLRFTADYDGDNGGAVNFGSFAYGANNALSIANPSGNAVVLQPSSGNVGIGTTPGTKLDVLDASTTTQTAAAFTSSNTGNFGGIVIKHNKASGEPIISWQNAGGEVGYTTWDPTLDAFQINDGNLVVGGNALYANGSSGRVGIGTLNPLAALDVNGGVNLTASLTSPSGTIGTVTNLMTKSEQINAAPWSSFGSTAISTDATTAPNGTTTAEKVDHGAGINAGRYQNIGISGAAGGRTFTFSIWMKADTSHTGRLQIKTASNTQTPVNVNVTTSWQRFTDTYTVPAGDTNTTVTAGFYIDDGVSYVSYVYAWGAQAEESPAASPYLATDAAPVSTNGIATNGTLRLVGSNTYGTTLKADSQTAEATYTLPPAQPSGIAFLKSAANGSLSWDTSTYLTTDIDTLATVTSRGKITGEKVGIGLTSGTPGAQLVVNNPQMTGRTGSSGDALYAFADSTNAAVSAEQNNAAGYAGYFSGTVKLSAATFEKVYLNVGTEYTDNTTEAQASGGSSFNLMNIGTSNNQRIYVGAGQPFSSVYIDITQAVVPVPESLSITYSRGDGSWATLTPAADGTNKLTQSGFITFTPPSGWGKNTVNGVSAYWLRIRFSPDMTIETAPTATFISPTGTKTLLTAGVGGNTAILNVLDSGQVGINTATPAVALSVNGTVGTNTVNNYANTNTLIVEESSDTKIGALSGQRIVFRDGTQENVVIDGSGNVGIGATTPDANYKLEATGLGIKSTSTSANVTQPAGYFNATGGAPGLIVDQGNVGIGKVSPLAKLDIKSDATALTEIGLAAIPLKFSNTDNGNYSGIWFQGVTVSDMYFGRGSNTDDLIISTAKQTQNELVRFKQNGNVGIGTASPLYRMDTTGSIASSQGFFLNTRPNLMTSGVYYGTDASGWSDEVTGATIASVTSPTNGFRGAFLRLQSDGTYNSDRLWASGGPMTTQFAEGNQYRISFRYRATASFTVRNRDFIFATVPANTGDASFFTTTYAPTPDPAPNDCDATCYVLIGFSGANQTVEVENFFIEDLSSAVTNRIALDALGNVGIGTAVPADKLHVVGAIRLPADSSAQINKYANNEETIVRTRRTDETQEGLFRSDGWGNFTFDRSVGIGYSLGAAQTGNLLVSGNVGVGTPAPDANYKLEASGLGIKSTSTSANVFQPAGYFNATGGAPGLIVDQGNVGIGTKAPQKNLDVSGDAQVANRASGALGVERILNGTFTGNSSNWQLGFGWAYGSDAVSHTQNGTAALEQNTLLAVPGHMYQVVFDAINVTQGSVTPQFGNVNGTQVNANGTDITQFITASATADIKFNPSNDFRGTIDNVSVKEVITGNLSVLGKIGIGTTAPISQLHLPGTIPTSGTRSGELFGTLPYSVTIQGKYAYIANLGTGYLVIYDVSNPASPVQESSTSLSQGATNLVVQGKYAYVSVANGGTVNIYDVSNPKSPTLENKTGTIVSPYALAVQGRFMYVTSTNAGSSKLYIFDVSNPKNASSLSNPVGQVATGNDPHAVVVDGQYAYIINNSAVSNSLQVIDVSDPANPTIKSTVTTNLSRPEGLSVQGRYAYVANNSSSSLQIFDIANPTSPQAVGSAYTAGIRNPYSLTVRGRYAYIPNSGSASVSVLDIADPAAPFLVGSIPTDTGPYSVAVQGRYAYVTSVTNNSFEIFDLGGTYSQSVEAGTVETSSLAAKMNAQIGGDLDVRGGIAVSRGIGSYGSISATTGGSAVDTISGFSSNSSKSAIYGENASGYAGYFSGRLAIEGVGNGANIFLTPSSQSADATYTLPTGVGAANDVLTIDTPTGSSATLKWAPGGGTNPWTTSGNNIYNSNSGNVGIGTESPDYALDVDGMIRGQSETGSGDVLIIGNDAKLTDIDLANTAGLYGAQDDTKASLKLGSGGGILSGYNGNIGIGTITPNAQLEIKTPTGATDGQGLRLTNSESGRSWELKSGSPLVSNDFFTIKDINADKVRLTITNGGNVGIATTNPGTTLDIGSTSDVDTTRTLRLTNQAFGLKLSGGGITGAQVIQSVGDTGYLEFQSGNSNDQKYVFSGGNVGIGQTLPSAKLVVNNGTTGTGSTGDAVAAYASSTNSALYAEQIGGGYAGYFSGDTVIGNAALTNNLIQNGDFSASGIWGYNAGWSWDATNKEADHAFNGGTNNIAQAFSVTANEVYVLYFDIRNRNFGTLTPRIGGANGSAVSSNGSFVQTITATQTGNLLLAFTPTDDFDGSLDNVLVHRRAARPGELRLAELNANGLQYVGFKAPDAVGTSQIYTLPDTAPSSTAFLKSSNSGVFSWDMNTYLTNETGDISDVTAGLGLTGGGSAGSVNLDVGAGNGIDAATDAVGIKLNTTSNVSATKVAPSGLEVAADGLSILRGCSAGQVLKWSDAAKSWGCATDQQGTPGSGYNTIVDDLNGALTQRTTLAFLGNGVNCVDNGTNTQTECTINTGSGGITRLNTLTAAEQTFAIGTAGTAPAWSSADTTHTLSIPLASAANVTAGLISKADYDAFTNKLSNALNSANIFVGNGSNVATGVALSGDATINNAGVLSIAADAVALGTDTTGNYVAGIGAGNDIDVTGTPGEGWSPTIDIESQLDTVTTIVRTSGDIAINPAEQLTISSADSDGSYKAIVGGNLKVNGNNATGPGLYVTNSTASGYGLIVDQAEVGINTTTPRTPLDVEGKTAVAASSVLESRGLLDVSAAASASVTGGTLSDGGPTFRGARSRWMVTSADANKDLTIDLGGSVEQLKAVTFGTEFREDNSYIPRDYTISYKNTTPCSDTSGYTQWFSGSNNTKASVVHIDAGANGLGSSQRCIKITVTGFQSSNQANVAGLRIYSQARAALGGKDLIALAPGVENNNAFLATTGNFGIGSTAPAYKLDVQGAGQFTGALKIGAYTLPNTDGTLNQVLQTNGTGTVTWQTVTAGGSQWTTTGNDIYNNNGGGTGKVGIGTNAAPATQLEVRGTSEQLRLSYDANNRLSATVSSVGGVTFDATGTGAGFTLSDATTLGGRLTLSNSGITGGGLSSDCDALTSKLLWDTTNKTFSCGIDQTTSGANIALSNLASVAINESLTPSATNSIDLGSSTRLWKTLYLGTSAIFQGATTDITTGTNEDLTIAPNGSGKVLFQPGGISTTGTVQIGVGGAGSTTPDFLALDVKSDTGDPAGGFEGAMYYNTYDNKFRCYQDAGWTDCIGSGGGGITGTGTQTANYLTKWATAGSTVTDSLVNDTGTYVGIGVASPISRLDIGGNYRTSGLGTADTGRLHVGAGGTSPDLAQIWWGDNTGWKLNFGTNVSGTFTPKVAFFDQGKVGIGQLSYNTNAAKDFAKFVVNNPTVLNKTGSNGDAIYAYADSTNAAISAEQADNSGYAGYFSGKVAVTGQLSVGSKTTNGNQFAVTGYATVPLDLGYTIACPEGYDHYDENGNGIQLGEAECKQTVATGWSHYDGARQVAVSTLVAGGSISSRARTYSLADTQIIRPITLDGNANYVTFTNWAGRWDSGSDVDVILPPLSLDYNVGKAITICTGDMASDPKTLWVHAASGDQMNALPSAGSRTKINYSGSWDCRTFVGFNDTTWGITAHAKETTSP